MSKDAEQTEGSFEIPEGLARTKEELKEKLEESKFDVELPSVTLRPCWDSVVKPIHPALDYVDGVAYVGTMMFWHLFKKNGEKMVRSYPTIITSDGKAIPLHGVYVAKLGLSLKRHVKDLPSRWSSESIKEFLDGKAEVDPEELYIAMKEALQTYIELEDPNAYDFLVLWSVGTYFFHLFSAFPYLYIGGIKQVGKTKLLTVLSRICFNAKFSTDITTSALFRSVENFRCTLLMDETENLSNPERNQAMRCLLLSGYKRGGVAERVNPNTYALETFEVYSPKALANIKGIEEILEERCIPIIMKRGKTPNIINAEVPLDADFWQKIRDMLYIFYLTHAKEIKELSENFSFSEGSEGCEGSEGQGRGIYNNIRGRQLELWKPVLTLALFFDRYINGLYKRMVDFAKEKAKERIIEDATENLHVILVKTLVELVKEDGFYKVKEVRDAMASKFEEEQKWLRNEWVGRALKRLGFLDKRAVGKGVEYFFRVSQIKDLAERLGIEKEEENETVVIDMQTWIKAVYESFRKRYNQSFNNVEFFHHFVDVFGVPKEEATNFFKQLVNNGLIFSTYQGVWVWT
jgi:hypothetical protein